METIAGRVVRGAGLWLFFHQVSAEAEAALVYSRELLSGVEALPPPPSRGYVPSGIFTAGGVLKTVLAGSGISAVAGILYPLVAILPTYIGLNAWPLLLACAAVILVAVGAAGFAGGLIASVADENGIRHVGVRRWSGVLASLGSWVSSPTVYWLAFGNPNYVSDVGFWGMAVFALATPLIVYGMLSAGTEVQTYCEICEAWCKVTKRAVVLHADAGGGDFVRQQILKGNLDAVERFVVAPAFAERAPRFHDISLFLCEKCHGFAALTLRAVTGSFDEKGKREERAEVLLDRLLVDPSVIRRLQKAKWTEGAV
jgi:hypothetical protein